MRARKITRHAIAVIESPRRAAIHRSRREFVKIGKELGWKPQYATLESILKRRGVAQGTPNAMACPQVVDTDGKQDGHLPSWLAKLSVPEVGE